MWHSDCATHPWHTRLQGVYTSENSHKLEMMAFLYEYEMSVRNPSPPLRLSRLRVEALAAYGRVLRPDQPRQRLETGRLEL